MQCYVIVRIVKEFFQIRVFFYNCIFRCTCTLIRTDFFVDGGRINGLPHIYFIYLMYTYRSYLCNISFRTDVGVFFCGPPALSHTLHTMSNQYSNIKEEVKFFYNKENF